MAISPRYENFSFVGSKEDLFTKYKRKCTTTTMRQKRSKIITFGVVIFLLVALIVGLSVGLHVQKKAKTSDASDKVEAYDKMEKLAEDIQTDRNVSSIASQSAILTAIAEATLKIENSSENKEKSPSTSKPLKPCPDGSKCI